MNGQAADAAPESGGLADLASFLDTPEEESNEELEAPADEATSEDADTVEDANSEQDDEDSDGQPEEEEEPAPAEKITFKVKGEDGAEETIEATPEELAASYLRQKDYTKKTQALAQRETEAVQFLTQKHEEIRSQYLSQAELTRAAIVNMAGIRSEAEMAQLANSDPAAWVAENQRQRQINSYLSELNQQIESEKQQQKAMQEQQLSYQRKQQFDTAWQELSKEGIDKPKLAQIYADASKNYGFTDEELGTVYDHRMVKVIRDAIAYRQLQSQKKEVTKKVQDAPRMPQRQTQPAKNQREQALENRFRSGRAKLNDLAALLR